MKDKLDEIINLIIGLREVDKLKKSKPYLGTRS